jgi:hypothetical protein
MPQNGPVFAIFAALLPFCNRRFQRFRTTTGVPPNGMFLKAYP